MSEPEARSGSIDDAQRWARIEELFSAALKRPAEARDDFLAVECAGDEALRERIDALLRADRRSSLLDEHSTEAAPGPRQEFPPEPAGCEPGTRIGAYRLVERLGRGGTSTVFLAVRDDDVYRQRVAIKILRMGLGDIGSEVRFRRERQILAALDHVNIGKILDGGTTSRGLPYLVMEHIEGVPIDDWCRGKSLSVRARTELFLDVLAAAQYAHQNLIVHRDLKPDNILVRSDGVAKLLDFGIAKLLNPELTGQIDPTRSDLLLLTPRYASPEQIQGRPITTASDVYSLGAVLFEVLTETRPYEIETDTMEELVRVVCEQEPRRASSALRSGTGPVRPRDLVGDLDHILAKALAKRPEDRYATAAGLADDLRRYLDGLPVQARGDRLTYRARKLVRRHWPVILGSLLALFTVAAFVVNTVVQSRRTAAALETARLEQSKTQAINSFLTEMLTSANPTKGDGYAVTLVDAVERAETSLTDHLDGKPGLEAEVRQLIGETYYGLGLWDRAEAMLRRALELRLTADAAAIDLANTLDPLSRSIEYQGRYSEAESHQREAIRLRVEAEGPSASATVRSMNNLATLLRKAGRLDEASTLFGQALDALDGREDEEAGWYRAAISQNLAVVLAMQGEYRQAASAFEAARERMEAARGPDHPAVATALQNLGQVLLLLADYEGAGAALSRAQAIRAERLGPESMAYGITLALRAEVALETGRGDTAREWIEEALRLQRQSVGEDSIEILEALNTAIAVRCRLDGCAGAGELLEQAQALLEAPDTEEAAPEARAAWARWRSHWALVNGDLELARKMAEQSRTIAEEKLASSDYFVGLALGARADVEAAAGRTEAAVEDYLQAISRLAAVAGPRSTPLLELRMRLAAALEGFGDLAGAAGELRAVLEAPPADPGLADAARESLARLGEAPGSAAGR